MPSQRHSRLRHRVHPAPSTSYYGINNTSTSTIRTQFLPRQPQDAIPPSFCNHTPPRTRFQRSCRRWLLLFALPAGPAPQSTTPQTCPIGYLACCPSGYELAGPSPPWPETRPAYNATCRSLATSLTITPYSTDSALPVAIWTGTAGDHAYAVPLEGYVTAMVNVGTRSLTHRASH